jgi:putative tryptophan/tyrosine transport system substrate-binding protein
VESWSVGSIRMKAVLQYSNISILRLRLCLTLCAILFALYASAEAQQPKKVPRIGYLAISSVSASKARIQAFQQGLRELGYVEGKNIIVEWRFAEEGQPERVAALAAELVRLNVDLIVTGGRGSTRAANEATSTIPIVMAQDADPVRNGFVASLARPGGNITGLANLSPELSGKRLELLKEIVPKLVSVAVLGTSTSPANTESLRETEIVAGALAVKLQYFDVRGPKDIESAFRTASKMGAEAVMGLGGPVLASQLTYFADLAVKSRLPAIYWRSDIAEIGGLVSYSVYLPDLDRRAATYVDKILKGAKPADLPVEQPTKLELIVNLKTAKQIGLTIPSSVLARADKVIK